MADLKDDETRLARFDKLSEESKAAIRKKAQDALRAAESERKRPLTSRMLDTITEFHPFVSKQMKADYAQRAAEDQTRRESRFQSAKQEAAMTDEDRARQRVLYGDTRVHKMNPDEPLFEEKKARGGMTKAYAKGGSVRGGGCEQRGKTKGRFV